MKIQLTREEVETAIREYLISRKIGWPEKIFIGVTIPGFFDNDPPYATFEALLRPGYQFPEGPVDK